MVTGADKTLAPPPPFSPSSPLLEETTGSRVVTDEGGDKVLIAPLSHEGPWNSRRLPLVVWRRAARAMHVPLLSSEESDETGGLWPWCGGHGFDSLVHNRRMMTPALLARPLGWAYPYWVPLFIPDAIQLEIHVSFEKPKNHWRLT
jgi:hypothetical protein